MMIIKIYCIAQKKKISTSDYIQELNIFFSNIAYTEITYTSTEIEALLLSEEINTPVNVDLNLPNQKNESENLNTKVTNPITADGKNITEAIAEVVKTKNTDKIKIEITDQIKNTDGTKTKEVVVVTETPNKKEKSNLLDLVKQAVVFTVVAVAINKITKSK